MIQVKLFDEEHEKDLEKKMNRFLEKVDEQKLVDIKYNIAALPYCNEGTQTLDPINLKQFILGDIELCNKDIGI